VRCVVKRSPLAPFADADQDLRGEEGVGGGLDLPGGSAARQQVGYGLDRLTAVEVGGVGGDGAIQGIEGQPRFQLDRLAAMPLAVKADLP